MGPELARLRADYLSAIQKSDVPSYLHPLIYETRYYHCKSSGAQTVADASGNIVTRDARFWVAWGVELTNHEGICKIPVNGTIYDQLPDPDGNWLRSKAVVFAVPTVLVSPLSKKPAFVAAEFALKPASQPSEPGAFWSTVDMEGNDLPNTQAFDLDLTVRTWKPNGDALADTMFSWYVVAEGGFASQWLAGG